MTGDLKGLEPITKMTLLQTPGGRWVLMPLRVVDGLRAVATGMLGVALIASLVSRQSSLPSRFVHDGFDVKGEGT